MNDNETAVFGRLQQSLIVAVLILDRVEDAVPVAEALLEGGVDVMELTLRTPAALGAVREIRDRVPGMLVGVGTILNVDQISQVLDAGGNFGVSPGTNPRVIEAALGAGLPFAPGICTPSDIERALEFDRKLLKFFPAEPSGGLKYLEAIGAPYAHLGVKYIPLGGVNPSNCNNWLASPLVGGIGGSWLASKPLIEAKNWNSVREAAAYAIAIRDGVYRAKKS
ncbi:MAG: bifunctional 4-hydroxy-2-oxoglutarate aldolase/2-dehydro-3-deoxy-phosphogluconate aldolase [Verrucomicrobiaceae bacterium]|nr:MAG: bifunctional 4-hydroxy-2-oxoglutarate aldolase/2-dehydro-3-deoxy-phosphogluconate aldolase [Verrucomicrobiaceae bacterium]